MCMHSAVEIAQTRIASAYLLHLPLLLPSFAGMSSRFTQSDNML